jgi:Uma2 family endonuclease
MTHPAHKLDKYTYADYLTWPETERWEIIEGVPYNMSPAPLREHQDILGNIFTEFKKFLKGKHCKSYVAPFDVRLAENTSEDVLVETVVQPDISVFCDEKKLDRRGANGAPDLIVEILSESTRNKDLNRKLLLYQRYGVREYWIVDPETNTILQYLADSVGLYYINKEYGMNETIECEIFQGLKMSLSEIFSI